ncbi:UDP-N-acetylmuramoyl-L-alanine--D-glutamate ligase [Alphaproteobacteria bacterium]|nr:UDP-N-acetylmuramoyl-L-alanine--D-glutamate ligase [Alphaproteobacteria bacterium]
MNSIINYKNQDVGILGLGLSGLAAARVLLNSKANIFVFDDKKEKPSIIKKCNWINYKYWPWESIKTLVVSPGIPINNKEKHNAIKLAIDNKVKIINDIDLFVEIYPKAKIIGITGTNGKSTTAALLFHILKFNKIKSVICGNFGIPACSINDPGENGVIILELSSYQLDGAKSLSLDIATIINITPDHLDYHETFDRYVSSKLKIINFLKRNGIFIYDKSNKLLNKIIDAHKYNSLKFSSVNEKEAKDFINDNNYLKGTHNTINASIAISIAKKLNINDIKIKLAIKRFEGLSHRMEPLYISRNFKIINDSKSTNGESTAAALKSFSNIFWIVGGKPKNDGIGQAKKFLDEVVEVFLIGNSTKYFSEEILKFNENIPINECITLEKATILAIKKSKMSKLKNCVILLSPSAASFDQFKSFEDRGNQFKKIISQQIKQGIV